MPGTGPEATPIEIERKFLVFKKTFTREQMQAGLDLCAANV